MQPSATSSQHPWATLRHPPRLQHSDLSSATCSHDMSTCTCARTTTRAPRPLSTARSTWHSMLPTSTYPCLTAMTLMMQLWRTLPNILFASLLRRGNILRKQWSCRTRKVAASSFRMSRSQTVMTGRMGWMQRSAHHTRYWNECTNWPLTKRTLVCAASLRLTTWMRRWHPSKNFLFFIPLYPAPPLEFMCTMCLYMFIYTHIAQFWPCNQLGLFGGPGTGVAEYLFRWQAHPGQQWWELSLCGLYSLGEGGREVGSDFPGHQSSTCMLDLPLPFV